MLTEYHGNHVQVIHFLSTLMCSDDYQEDTETGKI